jgi:hypothetical protein
MRNRPMTALLALIMASAVSSTMAESSKSDTNAPWFGLIAMVAAPSPEIFTEAVPAQQTISESAAEEPQAPVGDVPRPNVDIPQLDRLTVEHTNGWPFVDSVDTLSQRETLFRMLNMLLRAEIRGSPFSFGVDDEIRFVPRRDNRPSISAPLGLAFQTDPRAFRLFAELTPIIDDSLGWGGGLGIRLFFKR